MKAFFVLLVAVIGLSGCGMMKEMRGNLGAQTKTEAMTPVDADQDAGFVDEGEPRPKPRPERSAVGEPKPEVSTDPKPEVASEAKPKADPNAKARAACLAKGGRFQRSGVSGARICVTPTRDANKSCSASSQCEGMCLARSGTCSPITPLSGCHDIVTNAGNMATVCID